MVELQHSSSSERSLLQRADGHTNWDEVWRRERGRGSEYQVATTPGAPKEDERSIGVWERAIFAGVQEPRVYRVSFWKPGPQEQGFACRIPLNTGHSGARGLWLW